MVEYEHRLRVTLRSDGSLMVPRLKINKISYKKLGHLIREGYEIVVKKNLEDGSLMDLTIETLILIAMFPEPNKKTQKNMSAVQVALETACELMGMEELSEKVLYLIIENGGLDTYITRRGKGMVQYGQV